MRVRERVQAVARQLRLAFGLLVPLSATAAVAMHAYRAWEVPTPGDWEAVARAVRAQFQPGDRVAFLPGWAQEGRGLFAGLDVIPQERLTEDDVDRAARLHVVASFGAEPPRWLQTAATLEGREEHGRMRLYRFRMKGAADRLADLVPLVAKARVLLGGTECPLRAERHDCTAGRFGWRWVGPHRMRVSGALRTCIWAHPTTGVPLRIEIPAVPIGRTLLVGHGLADPVAGRGAPVEMEISVAGERAATIRHAPGRGWRRTRVDTTRWRGRVEAVRFVVTTPDDGARHFCFAAQTLR